MFFYKLDKIYIFFLGWEHILFKQKCSMAPKRKGMKNKYTSCGTQIVLLIIGTD